MENSIKSGLKKLLNGESLSQTEESVALSKLKELVYYAIKDVGIDALKNIYPRESVEREVLQEFVVKLLEKKDKLIPKLEKDIRIEAYLKLMIKNYLIDRLRKKRVETQELKDEYSNIANLKNELVYIEAKEFAIICREKLTKREKEALCLELSKPDWHNLDTSLQKAKTRAHKRVKELVSAEKFPIEVVEYSINHFFMSEICKEFVNLNRRKP